MTRFYDTAAVRSIVTPAFAMDAARSGFETEANGVATLPPRIDVPTPTGFYRCMPAVLGDYVGAKVMTLSRGVGNRYLLLVHAVADGDLLAVFDAEQITARRTAAVTTLAGAHMLPAAPTSLTLIGTGMEASSHLETMAAVWPISSADVWSRSAERREEFARRHSTELGIDVRVASSCAAAVSANRLVVLATKSEQPVLDGGDLRAGAIVLSIGSTRPVLRELDERTLRRTRQLVVDNASQVLDESGDIQTAVEQRWLGTQQLVALTDLVAKRTAVDASGGNDRDVLTFKSVGTALQDIALASKVIEADHSCAADLGVLAELKR